ncbi:hypothetical protein N7451_003903 [Penicillium sp. IBT 35674x]|nr:hypothetical protein N7451_003903 [Penicillium sp. IBT 35674x]
MEALHKTIKHSKKVAGIEPDCGHEKNLDEDNAKLEKMQIEYATRKHHLYIAESMIPEYPLKKNYEALRRDPRWYLRSELPPRTPQELDTVQWSVSVVLPTEDANCHWKRRGRRPGRSFSKGFDIRIQVIF